MGLLSYFRKRENTANQAKERLTLLIASDRKDSSISTAFLPRMREELLEVIARYYVNIDRDAVQVLMDRNDGMDVLEINISLR